MRNETWGVKSPWVPEWRAAAEQSMQPQRPRQWAEGDLVRQGVTGSVNVVPPRSFLKCCVCRRVQRPERDRDRLEPGHRSRAGSGLCPAGRRAPVAGACSWETSEGLDYRLQIGQAIQREKHVDCSSTHRAGVGGPGPRANRVGSLLRPRMFQHRRLTPRQPGNVLRAVLGVGPRGLAGRTPVVRGKTSAQPGVTGTESLWPQTWI